MIQCVKKLKSCSNYYRCDVQRSATSYCSFIYFLYCLLFCFIVVYVAHSHTTSLVTTPIHVILWILVTFVEPLVSTFTTWTFVIIIDSVSTFVTFRTTTLVIFHFIASLANVVWVNAPATATYTIVKGTYWCSFAALVAFTTFAALSNMITHITKLFLFDHFFQHNRC
jgi:hypothetical protein